VFPLRGPTPLNSALDCKGEFTVVALKLVLARLEQITTPPTSCTNDTKIYWPDESDLSPQAQFKRSLLTRCMTVRDAGKAKLQGQKVSLLPGIKEDDFTQIEQILAEDHEQREFYELLHVASTAQLLIDPEFAI